MTTAQKIPRPEEREMLAAARAGKRHAFDDLARPYIPELRAHCYRMLGSIHDANDAVQDTLVNAWRGLEGFDGRASLRTWLYKIATNACLDALKKVGSGRTLPTSRFDPADPSSPPGDFAFEPIWLEPFPDRFLSAPQAHPEALYAVRETLELAFMLTIHRLAPKQRAVLLLRDVLGWKLSEVADLLDTSIPAVKSALQRARALVRTENGSRRMRPTAAEEEQLLRRYMSAFEQRDLPGLVALIHEDAVMTMPPDPAWYQGRSAIVEFLSRWVFGVRPRLRVVPTAANGQPAMFIYEARGEASKYEPLAVQVLSMSPSGILEIIGFVDPSLIRFFDVPPELSQETLQ